MLVKIDKKGTVDGFVDLLKSIESDESVKGIAILACDENGFTPQDVDEHLKNSKKTIFGGIFPQILSNKEKLTKGTIIAGITQELKTSIVDDISNNEKDLDESLEEVFEDEDLNKKTMFVFIDGLSKRISALNDAMFNNWGITSNYIGGGAGSLSFVQKPCIFTNKGLLQDVAVLALSDVKSGVGVAHGWKPISEPLKVTEVDRNVVISLNWEPAFKVYREIVDKFSDKSFKDVEFFDLAKGYPFGITKMSDEMVVRDPIALDGDKMICVGEVPQGSFVNILQGNKDSLVEGAKHALKLAGDSFEKNHSKENAENLSTFFIDCISRVLFLEDDFSEELDTVYNDNTLIGALTLGEIANTGTAYLEFYNKTSVVALLEE